MLKSIMTAAILSVGFATAAIALPVSPGSQPAATNNVIQVKKGDWDHKGKWNKKKWSKKDNWKYGKGHHYKKGYGYRNPPPGWNQYAYRPWGWERRGCVVIGRAWFCP